MTRHKLFAIPGVALCTVVTSAPLDAITLDRDWPSAVVSPAIDVPMCETAITRGPDGVFYLSVVLDVPRSEWTPPWETSKEWDLEKPAGGFEKYRWLVRQAYKDPSCADNHGIA